jgi:glycolate oxidase iron-sulfur subunit
MRSWHENFAHTYWKGLLFGQVLVRPRLLEFATGPLGVIDSLGLRRAASGSSPYRWLPSRLRDMDAMLPQWPARPFRRALPALSPAAGKARYQVGFFLGCAQNLLFAEQSAATVRVLNRNGCSVITPRKTVCCGLPASAHGRDDLARAQAIRNIRAFEHTGVDVILTDCATCGSALKDYGRLLAEDPAWEGPAGRFSRKVQDISEFLLSISLRKPQKPLERRVTYHDPCHLRRGQGIWQQPRQLMQLIDGLDLVESPEADSCCGSAGSHLLTHYETSVRVLDRKTRNIAFTRAQVVAAGCPACRMQLGVGLRRSELDMQVVHPVQLLDTAYEL